MEHFAAKKMLEAIFFLLDPLIKETGTSQLPVTKHY